MDGRSGATPPLDLYITAELSRRSQRQPDYLKEKNAIQAIALRMSEHPALVLPQLVELAMEATGAVSSGISMYEEEPHPGQFRWHYLQGSLKAFDGATTPRDFSPCGICLDRSEPTLTRRPERYYDWIAEAKISTPEVLLVPLIAGGMPLGTLWVVAEREGHFDRGHTRVLTELAEFAGIAVHRLKFERDLNEALTTQQTLTREMAHRVNNLFMMAQGLVRVAARSASSVAEMRDELLERLSALADANALARRSPSAVAQERRVTDLAELIETVLKPHRNAPATTRFQVDGPTITLSEHAADGMALVIYELATNSAKYGAIESDEGRLAVSWQKRDDALELIWDENGGAPLKGRPERTGFGTDLTQRTVSGQFGGTIAYEWRSRGVCVTVTLPLRALTTTRRD